MLLSNADVKRLERAGNRRAEFVRVDRQGLAKLRNRNGYCVFYEAEKHRCRVYGVRPLGCRIYPVLFSEEEGVVVDDLCPLAVEVSGEEVASCAGKLRNLLGRVDREAAERKRRL